MVRVRVVGEAASSPSRTPSSSFNCIALMEPDRCSKHDTLIMNVQHPLNKQLIPSSVDNYLVSRHAYNKTKRFDVWLAPHGSSNTRTMAKLASEACRRFYRIQRRNSGRTEATQA